MPNGLVFLIPFEYWTNGGQLFSYVLVSIKMASLVNRGGFPVVSLGSTRLPVMVYNCHLQVVSHGTIDTKHETFVLFYQ